MKCHHRTVVFCVVLVKFMCLNVWVGLAGSVKHSTRGYHQFSESTQANSFYVPQVIGYNYPGLPLINNKPIVVRHETIVASASAPTSNTALPSSKHAVVVTAKPIPLTMTSSTSNPTQQQQVMTTFKVKATTEVLSTTTENVGGSSESSMEEMLIDSRNRLEPSAATQKDDARSSKNESMVGIKSIDVACGKERMTVRVAFDDRFDGVIYAKGYYNEPNCRFIGQNAGRKVYQFDMVVGQCGVSFIDGGLTSGGNAYVEGTIVTILEPGVQEAWDAARRIRCHWEGNIDQTVTFPLAINTLDSQTLTFSGDTASASLEIQSGRGPRAQPVQGLVRIGELLTAVVTVQGDTDFDLVVRNCVAIDGTQENRITLSDNMGCSIKPKLMGGWKKQKSVGNIAAYAFLTAFKFPDVMDLFLECTVSLCKGACDECPDSLEVPIPGKDADSKTNSRQNEVKTKGPSTSSKVRRRRRRDLEERNNVRFNNTNLAESLRLRRVVHVIGPEDLPEVAVAGLRPTIYGGGHCSDDCFSLLGVICTALATLLAMFATVALCGIVRRSQRAEKW